MFKVGDEARIIDDYSKGISKNQGKMSNVDRSLQKAYADFCRTIVKQGQKWSDFEEKEKYKHEWIESIKGFIKNVENDTTLTKVKFDKYHKEICDELVENGILTYGQAQKWVNMTLKDIFSLEYSTNSRPQWLPFAHIPLDGYIFRALKNYPDYKTANNKTPWSRIVNYDDYMVIQNWWRQKQATEYKGLSPLESEFIMWHNVK